MLKCAAIVAGLVVPVLVASLASAGPPKKKKGTKAAPAAPAPTAVTAAPTPPPPPVFDTKPKSSALSRVEAGVNGYEPKGPQGPQLTQWKNDGPPRGEAAGSTTLTSAELPAPLVAAPVAPRDPDAAPRAPRRDPLGPGFAVASLADFGSSKAYGFGVGARAGVTLESRVYLGGTFVYRVGEANGPMSYTMYYFGPEVGYNVPAGPLVIRPYVGGGYGALRTTYHGAGTIPGGGGAGVGDAFTGKSQTPFVWPGVTVLLPAFGSVAIGADARVVFAPGQDSSSGSLSNNGSLQFQPARGAPSTALVAGLTASYRF